jgi:hypothetical protein
MGVTETLVVRLPGDPAQTRSGIGPALVDLVLMSHATDIANARWSEGGAFKAIPPVRSKFCDGTTF